MKNSITKDNSENMDKVQNTLGKLKSFMLETKKIWIYLIILVISFLAFIHQLWERNYLSQKIVLNQKMPIEIVDLRQNITSSAIIKSSLDNVRVYEVDLGYFCKPNKNLIGTYVQMDLVLYKRNYNKTHFMDFPQAREKICL